MLLLCFTGCNHEREGYNNCEYETIDRSNIANYLWSSEETKHMSELVNGHCVKVNNQSVEKDGYYIALDEFFYEKNVPFVIYKFVITKENCEDFTSGEREQLTLLHNNNEIRFTDVDLGSTEILNELYVNINKAEWIVAKILDPISDKDKKNVIRDKVSLTKIHVIYKKDDIGVMNLPNYAFDANHITFDIEKSGSIKKIAATEFGVKIVWDISLVLKDFKEMLKKLPKGENPESYGYSIYEDITIDMKDGEKIDICNNDKNSILKSNEALFEENEIAAYSTLWNCKIPINEIKSITIDGIEYFAH